MKPTTCDLCRERFERDLLLQAEIRHIAATEGRSSAELELNERYQENHDEHVVAALGVSDE